MSPGNHLLVCYASVDFWLSSSHSKCLLQFNATTGAYEGRFTDIPINMATGFDFSFQTNNPDLYMTGQYAGNLYARFNSTNGQVVALAL